MEGLDPASNGNAVKGLLGSAVTQRATVTRLLPKIAINLVRGESPHEIFLGFEMLGPRTIVGLGLALAGLILLCASLSEIDVFPSARSSGSDGRQALAALAWTAAHCDSKSNAARPDPKLGRDDLIALSVTFDAIEDRHGHAAACTVATSAAQGGVVAIDAAAQPSRVAFEAASQSR